MVDVEQCFLWLSFFQIFHDLIEEGRNDTAVTFAKELESEFYPIFYNEDVQYNQLEVDKNLPGAEDLLDWPSVTYTQRHWKNYTQYSSKPLEIF